ncbi:MAG: M67 family metallopeptidase [Deltaproteobacteria bacterium]|nr:M67 family metallopeptidase [Deltaproteobacteria bacterium]
MLILEGTALNAMRAHAREAYPYECCGLMVGFDDERRVVHRALRLRNVNTESPQVRYDLDPLEVSRAEKSLAPRETILGIYHSHPDHPARPSQFDTDRAVETARLWPGVSYIVIAVKQGEVEAVRSWQLDESRQVFEAEPLEIA